MSMQNKPQMVEAVMFFNEQGGICKQMFYPEFDALLDGVADMPDFADRQMRAVYALINPRLQIKALVFFYLDFDEHGAPDKGWNMPLSQLAERAGRGPDLGAGPIRLACRSQCPVSWQQMHMWDPGLTPGQNDLALLRDVVRRNALGILAEDEAPALAAERLQVVAEDAWYAAGGPADETVRLERDHRATTARLIRQQRLRIVNLRQRHAHELADLRRHMAQQDRQWQAQHLDLQRTLHQQRTLNASLQAQLAAQAEAFQNARETMAERLRARLEAQMQKRIEAALAGHRQRLANREQDVPRRDPPQAGARQSGEPVLERLAGLGVVFVVYHPGAGHLTIPLQDIDRYQTDPTAYAAARCFVSTEHYRLWLAHYQKPVCQAVSTQTGQRCALSIERVEAPGRFVAGDSDCCARHKSSNRLRTVG